MPVDRGVIDAQLREIGEGERWWEQREFRDLPHVLNADERIRGLVNGKLLGSLRPRLLPRASWLIVVTDQRLICLRQERVGRKQVEIPAGQIIGIQHSGRVRAYHINLQTTQRLYRIRISKADAFRFLGAFQRLPPPSQPQPLAADATTVRLPGISAMASLPGLAGRASRTLLTPPDNVTRRDLARIETNVERLENSVERLQQQVEFLENILQQRTGESLPIPSAGDP